MIRGVHTSVLSTVGFFHFGSLNKRARIQSLEELLRDVQESTDGKSPGDSLIVLPEAFNIRGDYWENISPPRPLDPLIPEALVELSFEFKVAFVAGLIETHDHSQRYSCAYLIDGPIFEPLSYKKANDGSQNYQPCATTLNRVIPYRGVCLAALICMDALVNPNTEQYKALVRSSCDCRSKSGADHTILCVPADYRTIQSEEIANTWKSGVHIVIANANRAYSSVIQLKGSADPLYVKDSNNVVRLKSLL